MGIQFFRRHYQEADLESCLQVFDSNVPAFFLLEERSEYRSFLGDLPGPYFLLADGTDRALACGGYARSQADGVVDFCWGMVRRELHGQGLGRALTQLRLEAALNDPGVDRIRLHTSQHTVGFYERFGFTLSAFASDGYGPGLHRCEMEFAVEKRSGTSIGSRIGTE